jgi:uncharacterized repeat protein (TIGR01451 family)
VIEQQDSSEVRAGSDHKYTLLIKNVSDEPLHDVKVHQTMPSSFQMDNESMPSESEDIRRPQRRMQRQQQEDQKEDGPQQRDLRDQTKGKDAARAEGQSKTNRVWTIAMLAPHEEVQIQVSGVPTEVGDIKSCVYATYAKALCTTLRVVKPELSLTREWVDKEGRSRDRFLICDPIYVRYTIMNDGVGTTPSAVITEKLPKGLVAVEGGRKVSIDAGELEAGESETFTVALKARTVGQVSSRAIARAGKLSSRSNAQPIYLEEAEIDVSVEGRDNQYIGRDVEYTITVQNLSEEVPAKNTRVRIPGIDQRMRFANSNVKIPITVDVFTVGTIPPGESRSFSIVFSADKAGEVATRVEAMARCAKKASTTISTEFKGIPALQVVVKDQRDPVPTGEQTVYEISVLNEGSAVDADVKLTGELPDSLEFVSATGDSDVTAKGSKIEFAPVQNLAPGERASWLITVRGVKPGKGEFKVDLTSRSGSSSSGEPTTVY